MSPLQHSNHLAARMGRWSASHWKTAVFGWLAFVVLAFMAGGKIGMNTIDLQDANVGQAHHADNILKESGFGQTDPQTEIVLVQSKTQTVNDPAFRAAVNDVARSVAPYRAVKNLRTPYQAGHADQISKDGHTAVVFWEMKGTADHAKTKIDAITATTAKVAARHPSLYVGEAGSVSSGKAIEAMFSEQLGKAGTRSLPLTLIILLLVFGSVVAAFVPLLLALSSVLATIGLISFVSKITPMDQSVTEVILLIGLAVGIDYSLFYLKREREERAAGKGHRAALEAAAATSGRAVLISGPDGDGRDGRARLHPRQDVRLVRHRHDPRRPRLDDRLADGAAGDPRQARRQGREGPHPLPRPLPPRRRREPRLVEGPHAGHAAPRHLGAPRDRRPRRDGRPGAAPAHGTVGPRRTPEERADGGHPRPHPGRIRRHLAAGGGRRQDRVDRHRCVQECGSRLASPRREEQHAPDPRYLRRRPVAPCRAHRSPDRRQRRRQDLGEGPGRASQRHPPVDRRAGPQIRIGPSPATRRRRTTTTP